jgi:hypothetical protein
VAQPFFGPVWLNSYLVVNNELFLGGNGVYKTPILNPYITKVAEPTISENNSLTISPNPAKENITISFKSPDMSNVAVCLVDLSGKTIKSLGALPFASTLEVFIGDLPAGFYSIKAVHESSISTTSFIKIN